jgi:hypothetical protein
MSRDTARALIQFFGGRICLDFANTVDWRTSQAPQELLPGYEALLTWSRARRTLARSASKTPRPQRRPCSKRTRCGRRSGRWPKPCVSSSGCS